MLRKKLVFLFSIFPFALAASSLGFIPSLSWQQNEIERKIYERVERSILAVIERKDFIVNVDVQVSIPETPDFHISDLEAELLEEIAESDDSIDPFAGESQALIRFSNERPNENADGFIAFSKLGMLAPLIDDFNDFRPDGKLLLTMDGQELLDGETGDGPSYVEQIWKLNQAMDIFSNLRSVTITVTLNDSLAQTTRDTLERLLNSLNFNLGAVTPTVDIEYLPLNESRIDQRSFLAKLSSFFDRYNLLIAIVLAALIIALAAYFILKEYLKMNKGGDDKGAEMSMSGDLNNKFEDKEDESGDPASLAGGDGDEGLSQEFAGIERFKSFFEKSQYDACLLVKRWIKDQGEKESNALRALVQQLDNTLLIDIFKILTEDERESWKGLLHKSLNRDQLISANQFMSNQIVEEIILPSLITDKDICDYLLKIRPERAAELAQEHPHFGKMLLNTMNTKFVNQIIEKVDPSHVDQLIDSSLQFDPKEIQENLEEFKKVLASYVDDSQKIPFLKKLKELIPVSMPSKELPMYNALLKSGEVDQVIDLAMESFPSHLIEKLPEGFIKTVLTSYPLKSKVEFLLSRDEQSREFFVGLSAPEGSKARDLLDIEFESAKDDITIQKRIHQQKDQVLKEFVDHVRNEIKNNKTVESDVYQVIQQWASSFKGQKQSVDDNVLDLKTG